MSDPSITPQAEPAPAPEQTQPLPPSDVSPTAEVVSDPAPEQPAEPAPAAEPEETQTVEGATATPADDTTVPVADAPDSAVATTPAQPTDVATTPVAPSDDETEPATAPEGDEPIEPTVIHERVFTVGSKHHDVLTSIDVFDHSGNIAAVVSQMVQHGLRPVGAVEFLGARRNTDGVSADLVYRVPAVFAVELDVPVAVATIEPADAVVASTSDEPAEA